MLRDYDANNSSAITRHTDYGILYNRIRLARDRTMPTMLGLQNYALHGSYPQGFRRYNTPPTLALETQEYSRFAYADLPPVERPLPWDRVKKSQSVG